MDDHGTNLEVKEEGNLAVATPAEQAENLPHSQDTETVRVEIGDAQGERIKPPTAAAELANTQQRIRELESRIQNNFAIAEKADKAAEQAAIQDGSALAVVSVPSVEGVSRSEVTRTAAVSASLGAETETRVSREPALRVATTSSISTTREQEITAAVSEHMSRFRDLAAKAEKYENGSVWDKMIRSFVVDTEILISATGIPKAEEVQASQERAFENLITKINEERLKQGLEVLNASEASIARRAFNKEYKAEREAMRDLELKYIVGAQPLAERAESTAAIAEKYSDLSSTRQSIQRTERQLQVDRAIEEIRNYGRQVQTEHGRAFVQELGDDYHRLKRSHLNLLTREEIHKAYREGQKAALETILGKREASLRREARRLAMSDYTDRPSKDAIKRIFENKFDKVSEAESQIFLKEYERVREQQWNKLSGIEKAWHGVGNWVSGALEDTGAWLGGAIEDVTEFGKDAWEYTKKLGTGIGEISKDVYNWAADLSWEKVGNGISWAAGKTWDGICWCGGKIKDGAVWCIEEGADFIAEQVVEFCNDPWGYTKKAFTAAWDGICTLANGIKDVFVWCLEKQVELMQLAYYTATGAWEKRDEIWNKVKNDFNKVVKVVKAVGSFLKDLSDDIGLTDLVVGIGGWIKGQALAGWEVVKAFAVATAILLTTFDAKKAFAALRKGLKKSWEALTEGLKALKDGLLGGLNLLLEFTGIKDLGLMCMYLGRAIILYGQGRKGEALLAFGMGAMHGLFAGPKLVLSLFTGGLAAGAVSFVHRGATMLLRKTLVRKLAKEGASLMLTKGGKEFGERIVTRVGPEAIEKATVEATQRGIKEFDSIVHKFAVDANGNMAPEALKEFGQQASDIMAKHNKKAVNDLFEKSGVMKEVTTEISDTLLRVEALSVKELRQELMQKRLMVMVEQEGKEISEKFLKKLTKGKGLSTRELKKLLGPAEFKRIKKQAWGLKIASGSKKAWLGKNGAGRALEKEIIADTQEHALKHTGKAKEIWEKHIDELAELQGYSDEVVGTLKTSGREGIERGVREGVEKPLKKAIRKGVKEGVKRAKKRRKQKFKRRLTLGASSSKKSVKSANGKLGNEHFTIKLSDVYDEQLGKFADVRRSRTEMLEHARDAAKKRLRKQKNMSAAA